MTRHLHPTPASLKEELSSIHTTWPFPVCPQRNLQQLPHRRFFRFAHRSHLPDAWHTRQPLRRPYRHLPHRGDRRRYTSGRRARGIRHKAHGSPHALRSFPGPYHRNPPLIPFRIPPVPLNGQLNLLQVKNLQQICFYIHTYKNPYKLLVNPCSIQKHQYHRKSKVGKNIL